MKLKNFLMSYMGSNHNVDDLDVWVYTPPKDDEVDGESVQLKRSLRNYLLFGDYYVGGINVDWYPNMPGKRNPYLSISITKEPTDPMQDCPFAYY